MPKGRLEHANITVSDIDRLSALLQELLGWHERWRGPALGGGETIHVGEEFGYIALYTDRQPHDAFAKGQPLNHVGLVVDDIDAAEKVVVKAGLVPFNHADYAPGRRFYFFDWDHIEFELVSYE
ncbi:VOC family protein [Novosphingobium profundi]|uniref:VOC family protein n=1 Tax=Novosphingobium profundi TaxID=1774954 RepID=UPI001BDB2056|nr:VOC family protein [Novosphingobium profundi]MBT0669909.1 VOC family protein [Novosphingobium profundi]